MRRPFTDEQRMWAFFAKFTLSDGCWEWQASVNPKGYGYFMHPASDGRRGKLAHRASYELFVGPLPPGSHIDHLCRNPACVRPDHLEVVSALENQLRGYRNQNGRKELCNYGHEFDRFYIDHRTGHPWRACSTCNRERKRAWRERRRAA